MILDTSAIAAIVFKEPGFQATLEKVVATEHIGIGGPTAVETGIVLSARLARDATGLLGRLLAEWQTVVVPFGDDHWKEAVRAYARFGRGRQRASLNFGDCLAYAVAKLANEPLLCVGDDFSRTDIDLA